MKKKQDKKKKGLLIALFVAALLMAVGYAAYSQDLFIDATGGIINDWKLQFVDDNHGDTATANVGKMFMVDEDNPFGDRITGQGIKQEDGPVQITTRTKENDLIVDLAASFSFPEEEFVYVVTVANFSQSWNAVFNEVTIEYFTDSARTTPFDDDDDRYITWELVPVLDEGGSQTDVLAVSPNGTNPNLTTDEEGYKYYYLIGTWDKNITDYPADPNGATKTWSDTYKEYVRITLNFEAEEPTP